MFLRTLSLLGSWPQHLGSLTARALSAQREGQGSPWQKAKENISFLCPVPGLCQSETVVRRGHLCRGGGGEQSQDSQIDASGLYIMQVFTLHEVNIWA